MEVLLRRGHVLVAHQVGDADQVAGPAPFRPATMTEVVDAELAGTVRADARSTCRLPEHIPTIDGSIKGWLAVLDDLSRRKADRVVPGHGPASMEFPQALEPERRYLETVAKDVRQAIAEGKTLAEATKTAGFSEKDAWKLFDQYHVRNVTAAFAELEWE